MTKLEEFDLEWTEGYIDRLIDESVFYRVDYINDFCKSIGINVFKKIYYDG